MIEYREYSCFFYMIKCNNSLTKIWYKDYCVMQQHVDGSV